MAGWLPGLLAGWLAGWLPGLLAGWLDGWPVGQAAGLDQTRSVLMFRVHWMFLCLELWNQTVLASFPFERECS